MSLNMNALTILSTCKTHLGIATDVSTHDSIIEQLINAASDAIESYCNRKFKSQEHTETYDGNGSEYLVLRHYPISAVSAVSENGSDLSADDEDYEILTDEGILYREVGWSEDARNIDVTYTAGYVLPQDADEETPATLPEALSVACIMYVKAVYNDLAFKDNERLGDYSVKYNKQFTDNSGKPVPVPPVVAALVAPYKGRW